MSERRSGSSKYVHSRPCHSLPAWRCLKTWYGSMKLLHAWKGVCLLDVIWCLDIQWIYPMHAGEYRPCHSVPTRRCLKTLLGTMEHPRHAMGSPDHLAKPHEQWEREFRGRLQPELYNQNYKILPLQGPLPMILFQDPHLITQCSCCFDVHSWCCVIAVQRKTGNDDFSKMNGFITAQVILFRQKCKEPDAGKMRLVRA